MIHRNVRREAVKSHRDVKPIVGCINAMDIMFDHDTFNEPV
jgi:hypothetical protein